MSALRNSIRACRIVEHFIKTSTCISISQRALRTACCLRRDQVEPSSRNTVVDDDVHKALAGNKIQYQNRKSWVGYNPFKESVSADWISVLSRRINWETYIEDKLAEREMAKLRSMQEYSAERRKVLGGELAAARFIVAMQGKVKLYGDDHCYCRDTEKAKKLPTTKTKGLVVEAADLSSTRLIYEGMENLFQAESILELKLSSCRWLDEWSVSRLAMMPSLISLDLSHNKYITERSLIPLQHIPNLRKLNLSGIKYFTGQPLPLIYLEELLPDCVIIIDEVGHEQT